MIKTTEDVMACRPCDDYTEEMIDSLVGSGINEDGVLELDIPVEDKVWAYIYVWMTHKQRVCFACDCAQRALERESREGREPHPASRKAVEVARRWIDGNATDEEVYATYTAAYAVINGNAKTIDTAYITAYEEAYAATNTAHAAARAANAAAEEAYAARTAARVANISIYAAFNAANAYVVYNATEEAEESYTVCAANDAAEEAERQWQVQRAFEIIKRGAR